MVLYIGGPWGREARMNDRYRIDRTFGGSYRVRETDFVEDAFVGAAAIAGNILGASINGLAKAARNAQDRRMQRAVDAMEAAAEANEADRLLSLAAEFVERYPQQPYGHAFLAFALLAKSQHDRAIAATERAVQLGLDESEARMIRASAYERKGSIGKAIQEFSALIRNPETRSYGLLNRALALVEIGDLDQALDDINRGIADSPDEFFYYARGNTYLAKGDLAKAVDDYLRVYRLSPNWTDVMESRAEVSELLARTEEAQRRGDDTRDEAIAFLADLNQHHVQLKLAPNGRDIIFEGALRRPIIASTFQRLKPQLLQLLRDKQCSPIQ